MATIHYSANASSWQEAFTERAPMLYRYFKAFFRKRNDADEYVQEAVCLCLIACRSGWKPGTGFAQQLLFQAINALGRRRFVWEGMGRRESVPAKRAGALDADLRHRPLLSAEERRDFWLDVRELPSRTALILHLLASGHTHRTICNRLNIGHARIRQAVAAARLILAD